MSLVTEDQLGIASTTTKQLRFEICKLLSDINVGVHLKEVGLGAQEQQRKPFLSRKHVLERLRFAQRYESWTIDDWKLVIFTYKTKINKVNSDGKSWRWIGDGEHVGPQHVYQTVKHGGGLVMIWGCMTDFRPGAWH